MNYTEAAHRLPRWLRARILHFEEMIERSVEEFASRMPAGARVLDAGSGEGRHRAQFPACRYTGVDLAIGDAAWNYASLDAICDLAALPFADRSFDGALNIVTLEHVPDPARVLAEIHRVLRPGAPFLLIVPHEWEVHQAPHDYFRYTRHGIGHLLRRAGFSSFTIEPAGGYFRLLARRLLNGLQFFSKGSRWIFFVPACLVAGPLALLLPSLDFLDRDQNFTLGYRCLVRKDS